MAKFYEIRVMTKHNTVEDVSISSIGRERMPEPFIEHIGQTEFRHIYLERKGTAISVAVGWMHLIGNEQFYEK